MLFKGLRAAALLAVASIGIVSHASAGVTTTYVANLFNTIGAHREQFNDDSYETAIIPGFPGDSTLDVGDVLYGIFRISDIGRVGGTFPPSPTASRISVGTATFPELTGIFAAEISSKGGGPGAYTFGFKPYAAFEGLLGYTGAMAALYEDVSLDFDGSADIATSFAAASNGTIQTVLGFTGVGGAAAAYEGWSASTTSDDVVAVASSTDLFGSYKANLNTVAALAFSSLVIPKGETSSFSPSPPTGFTQFSINGQLFGRPDNPSDSWPLGDSTDIFFRVSGVVPEPGSMLMWAGLAAMVGFGGYRRSKKLAV